MKHICPHSSNITQTDLLSIIQENVFSRLYLNTDIRKDVEAYIRVFTENIIVKQLDNVQDATRRLKSITEEKRKLLLKFLDVNNSSPIQKVISDEIEKKTKEEEKLNTYIKKLKQNQAFEYTEVAE